MKKVSELISFQVGDVHKIYHEFCDYMKKWYYKKEYFYKKDFTQSTRMIKEFDVSKLTGYTAIQRGERFSKKYPDDIHIIHCDDDVFASSDLILVEHLDKEKKSFMGTTVIFIPQCTSVQNSFFLYPNHLDKLIQTLQKIQKKQRINKK